MNIENTFAYARKHLVSLGYAVSDLDEGLARASHATEHDFSLSVDDISISLIRMWPANDTATNQKLRYLTFANLLSQRSSVVHYTVFDHRNAAMGRARYFGVYEQEAFARFFDLWVKDWDAFYQLEDTVTFFG